MRSRTEDLRAVASDVVAGTEVVIGATYPLREYREAYAQAAGGKTLGKVVFVIDG